jgi:hypothetical protein
MKQKPAQFTPFWVFFKELLKKHPKWVIVGAFLHEKKPTLCTFVDTVAFGERFVFYTF